MKYYVKCTSPERTVCVRCGASVLVSADKTRGRCGHCGCEISIEITEKVIVKEDHPKKKEWIQMALFTTE